jgi:4-diphosphocytidyl-2-C-methyl-D-erythritol kinase
MRVRAFAKINLSLRVLGTRPDGYHELRTIFQSIALHDTLTMRRVNGPLRITCDDPSLPCDRTNLVWRAAEALWKAARRRGMPRGVAIHLEKRIPRQAGLGGGSSDAAATLRALEKLWRPDPQCVREAAVRLGADVPFFLEGGTVLGLERGDVLFPLRDRPRAWVVLIAPAFGISTPEAYRWWDEARGRTRDGAGTEQGRTRDGVGTDLGPSPTAINDLQAPVVQRYPEIGRIVRALARAGATCAAMSGSGSAVFGLFETRADAMAAAASVPSGARRTFVTRTTTRAEHQRLAAN